MIGSVRERVAIDDEKRPLTSHVGIPSRTEFGLRPRRGLVARPAVRRRRFGPSFALSALAHALLLALAIWWARQRVEQQEWLPQPSFDMVFEGGKPEKPTVTAPEKQPNAKPPESAPAAPPAPTPAAPARQAAPAPAPSALPEEQAPPPTPAPPTVQPPSAAAPSPRVSIPLAPLPAPETGVELIPAPSPVTPAPAPQPAPRPRPRAPAFPAPMTFSFGGPAAPPAIRRPPGRGIDLSFGRGFMGAEDTRIFGRSDSKEVGPDWFNRFAAWWDRHRYYPPQAGENGEQGDVALDLVVARSGKVQHVVLASGSGSQWLDLAALGIFRDATLPPLPSDAAATVPIHLTIHYQIIRR